MTMKFSILVFLGWMWWWVSSP